jgi:tetratricopeptide (TPR) repeat protein
MAEIFVSYTSSDKAWADWIGQKLEALGHTPHLHDWEISGGGNVMAWMSERADAAAHVLCVVSEKYLKAPYSSLERTAAEWAAVKKRPNFALPVFVEPCEPPVLFAPLKRCDLYGITEEEARARLTAFLTPAAKPAGPIPFPGGALAKKSDSFRPEAVAFPGARLALSNIPVRVPLHFLGRDDALAAIGEALKRHAVIAVHGLRGAGKTTLAAAFAEKHRGDYRATWWIRAQTDSTMRADLVALGVRLNWVSADAKEEEAFAAVLDHLRGEGEGLLLIYDNAVDAAAVRPYLPRGGGAKALVTSTAHAWRGVAELLELPLWPKDIGADYLIARTGRRTERAAAEALSEALGGLPLAHEQAACYCDRLGISFKEYNERFERAPVWLLDTAKDAPGEYHGGLTVAKTFALAIDEASKLHPAAEPMVVHAALLAPEPVPLFFFSEAREKFGQPLSNALAGDGLDEAVAALRTFALVDKETIADERDPAITTDCIRLHRLVRAVAAARAEGDAREPMLRALIEAMAAVYPANAYNDADSWPRARRLDALALAVLGGDAPPLKGKEEQAAELLNRLGSYRHGALAAYAQARPLYERALAIREKVLGAEHPDTVLSLNNLALLLHTQGDNEGARPLYERALAIREKALGPEHPSTATSLNNLALSLHDQGELAAARPLYERALAIREKVLGAEHPDTANSLNNLASLLQAQGDYSGARPLYERALAIREKVLGPEHPDTATSLSNLAVLLRKIGNTAEAGPLFERAIAIGEKARGSEHPLTERYRSHYARLLLDTGRPVEALSLGQAALAIHAGTNGPDHIWTKDSARVTADALDALSRADEAAALRARFGFPQKPKPSA